MKKLLILSICSILSISLVAQQRLAILPMAESIELTLAQSSQVIKTICIDPEEAIPSGIYNNVLSDGKEEIFINGKEYNGGLRELIKDGIIEINTNYTYSNPSLVLKENAKYNGELVKSLKYKQLESNGIGNQTHTKDGILTNTILNNFDLAKLKDQNDIQNRFWEIKETIDKLSKEKLIALSDNEVLDNKTKEFIENTTLLRAYNFTYLYENTSTQINELANKLGIENNLSLEDKTNKIAEKLNLSKINLAINQIKVNNTKLIDNKIILDIQKSKYDDRIGMKLRFGDKEEFWEKGSYGIDRNEIKNSRDNEIQKIGNCYLVGDKIVMDAIDLPGAIVDKIRDNYGPGNTVIMKFTDNISEPEINAIQKIVGVKSPFKIENLDIYSQLSNRSFNISRTTVTNLNNGFIIKIPQNELRANQSSGSLILRIQGLLQSSIARARIGINSIINRYKGINTVDDFLSDLDDELDELQRTNPKVNFKAELEDFYITKITRQFIYAPANYLAANN